MERTWKKSSPFRRATGKAPRARHPQSSKLCSHYIEHQYSLSKAKCCVLASSGNRYQQQQQQPAPPNVTPSALWTIIQM
eukprot:scaffold136_cov203-Alexandrium_tamarense.AAC.2